MVFDKLRAFLHPRKEENPSPLATGISTLDGAVAPPFPFEEGTTFIQVKGGSATFMSSLPPEDLAGGVNFIAWLSDDEQKSFPVLPVAAYLGVLVRREKQEKPNIFLTNLAYLEFLHYSVAEVVPQLPDFVGSVRGQLTGTLFIFDGRYRDQNKSIPSENLPNEEIIGLFGITDGQIAESSYLRNTNYKVWSSLGLAQLPPYLRAPLITKLATMASSESGTPGTSGKV